MYSSSTALQRSAGHSLPNSSGRCQPRPAVSPSLHHAQTLPRFAPQSGFGSAASGQEDGGSSPHMALGSAARLGRPTLPHRLQRLQARAGKGGDKGDKAKREESKADFSALWARRFKQFFSARRNYLKDADASPDDEAAAKKYEKEMAATDATIRDLKEQIVKSRTETYTAKVQRYANVLQAAQEEANRVTEPLARSLGLDPSQVALTPVPVGEVSTSGRELVEADITNARQELRTSLGVKVAISVGRAREVLKSLILFPVTAILSLHRAWQQVFTSQSYQNFLMSEGERIWFWRNRMENERWFWERYAWDCLLFPAICGIGYQYITPPHFVWAVVVPLALSMWQHGHLPGIFSIDFWAIAYFGFYQKCWPEFSAAAMNLFLGW